MKTSIISRKALLAVSYTTGKDKTRYYLNGVYVEVTARHVTYVATDGHLLLACRSVIAKDAPDNTLIGSFIIPNETLGNRSLKGDKLSNDLVTITGESTTDQLTIDNTLLFKPIGGTFPDYRYIIPTTTDGVTAVFNPEYLVKAQKAFKLMCYSDDGLFDIGYNGTGFALLTRQGCDLFGVVMPIRSSDAELPSWFNDKDETESLEQACAA